jgi:hypothetical protein
MIRFLVEDLIPHLNIDTEDLIIKECNGTEENNERRLEEADIIEFDDIEDPLGVLKLRSPFML